MQPTKWPGDKGKTKMADESEVSKDSPMLEAIGTIDELSSFVGMAISKIKDEKTSSALRNVQSDLFTICAELAGAKKQLGTKEIVQLEQIVFALDKTLSKLENFILPGGCEEAALLHACRTVCRRAERRVVSLKRERIINDNIIKYLNRLSYLFFQLARQCNEKQGIKESKW